MITTYVLENDYHKKARMERLLPFSGSKKAVQRHFHYLCIAFEQLLRVAVGTLAQMVSHLISFKNDLLCLTSCLSLKPLLVTISQAKRKEEEK